MPEATVIKLDVEGAEFDVVPAQIDDLPRARVWIVEIHSGRGKDPNLILGAFRERAFELWWGHPASGESSGTPGSRGRREAPWSRSAETERSAHFR